MNAKYKAMRLDALDRAAHRNLPLGEVVRPRAGWLRAIREGLGLTLRELATRLGVTVPAVRSLERAEAEDRITLASLRRVAAAMGCEVVYGLVPRVGSLAALAEHEARREVAPHIEAAEHSMRLEAQAAGGTEKRIAAEARRRTRGEI